MTTSPSSSDYSSTEDSIYECKSNQSASVGYYPSENTFSYEDLVSREETACVDSLVHFLPPVQSTWRTESLRRLFRKRDQVEHDPEQFSKLSITLAWDIDVDSNHADSLANLDLNAHSQWMDKWPEDKTKLTPCKLYNLVQKLETFLGKEKGGQHDGCVLPESTQKKDVHLNSTTPPHTAQVSPKERDVCQDLSKHRSLENEDICQVLEDPPRLLKDEVVQEIRQASESSLETSSVSSPQPEGASRSHNIFCMNFRWVFQWLRTQIFSRWRRQRPSQATNTWHQKAVRNIHSLRSNRIQPQE
ncbi:mCG7107, isoform CRA_b [Mus musculus]|nr:mCG7107, isoform CRA_b [Mus musculus]